MCCELSGTLHSQLHVGLAGRWSLYRGVGVTQFSRPLARLGLGCMTAHLLLRERVVLRKAHLVVTEQEAGGCKHDAEEGTSDLATDRTRFFVEIAVTNRVSLRCVKTPRRDVLLANTSALFSHITPNATHNATQLVSLV